MNAQLNERRFHQLDPAQLPSPFVIELMQDSDGFIWLATRNGLCRFDGKNVRAFQNSPDDSSSIPESHVRTFLEDRRGNFWVGTFGAGICRYDKFSETFTPYLNAETKAGNRIHRMAEDKEGNIWLATEGGGLQYYDVEKGRVVQAEVAKELFPKTQFLRSVLADSEGRIWCGTQADGAFVFDPAKKDTRFVEAPGLGKRTVISFWNGRSGEMYMGTDSGFLAIDEASLQVRYHFTTEQAGNTLVNNRIYTLKGDPTGRIWLGTLNGLSIFDPKSLKFENYHRNPVDATSLHDQRIMALECDRSGMMWLGSWESGICSTPVYTSPFRQWFDNPAKSDQPALEQPWGLSEDNDGNLWLSLHSKLLTRLNLKSGLWKSFTKEELRIPSNNTWGIHFSPRYRLLLGTNGHGVMQIDENTLKVRNLLKNPTESQLQPQYAISGFLEDRTQGLWVASFNGLHHLKEGKWVTYTFRNLSGKFDLPMNQISTMVQGKNGMLFLGMNGGGLVCFQSKTRQYVVLKKGMGDGTLKSNFINSLLVDRSERLWVASDGDGIYYTSATQPGRFCPIGQNGEIPEKEIKNLLMDNGGNIWAAGREVYKIEPQSLNGKTRFLISAYASEHLLESNPGIINSRCKMQDGRLVFGGAKGITTFYPQEVVNRFNAPRLLITGCKLFQNEVRTDTAIAFKKKWNLTYNQNFIALSVSNMSHFGADQSRIFYRLKGLNEQWLEAKSSDITFNGLPPGLYEFETKATNQGNMNSEVCRLWIEISPPWWKTVWFYGLLGFSLVGVTIGSVQYRFGQIRKQERARSAHEVEKLHLELKALRMQMNPHFMFNALNSIENFIWKNEVHEAADYLAKFARLMRLVLENSHFETVGLDKELEAIRTYIELEALRLEGRFEYTLEIETAHPPEEMKVVPMLIQPFVENAILHGIIPLKKSGLLRIYIAEREDRLRIVVEDNGVGRRPKPDGRPHYSMGMQLTRERILKLNQGNENSIQIKDLKDMQGNPTGTQVEIVIPFEGF